MKRMALLALSAVLSAVPVLHADDAPRDTRTPAPADHSRTSRTTAPDDDSARPARRERDAAVRTGHPEPTVIDLIGGRGGVRGEATAAAYIASVEPDAGLTDDQKKSITSIFETRDQALKDFEASSGEKLKTASKALRDAYQARDREAMAKAQEDYRDVLTPIHEIMRKANEDLANVLTADQKSKVERKRRVAELKNFAAPVELTEDQIKQLLDIMAASGDERGGLREKVYPALEQMLTPEQKAVFTRHRVVEQVHGVLGIRLTREQTSAMESAYDDLAKDTTLAREDLVKKLTEKAQSLLTDEQKAAIANRPQRTGERGTRTREDSGEPRKTTQERGTN